MLAKIKLPVIYFCLILLFLPILSCNKETENTQPLQQMTGNQTSYFPGEIAILTISNGKLDDGTYPGTFDGKALDWLIIDNKAFIRIPSINEGEYQAELKYSGTTITYDTKIKAAPNVRPAQEYLNESIERTITMKETVSMLSGSLDSSKVKNFALEAIERQALRDSMQAAFEALTPQEKIDFAVFMSANEHYLIEMHSSIQDLSDAFSQLQRPAGAVEDYEHTIDAAIVKFIHAGVQAAANIPLIAALTKVGVTSAFGGPGGWFISGGAFLAGVYFMVDFIEELQALVGATGALLNTAMVPFSELDGDVKQFKANVALVNNIKCLYRSIYHEDKTAAPNGKIKLVVEAIINLYNSTLDILPKLPPRFRPKVSITSLDDLTNYFTKQRTVFNNYLKIDPVTSDPSIQVMQIRNGDGSTSLLFSGTSPIDKEVTYKLRYENPGYVPSFEKRSYAKIIFKSTCPDTVSDIDGNVYHTVSIGTQCWFKENLRTSKYSNGDQIPTGLSDSQWWNTNSGACDVNPANIIEYGKFYNWYAVVDLRGLCPAGWHVPTVHDWNLLIRYLDPVSDTTYVNNTGNTAGSQMGSTSGFSGLPTWYRVPGGYCCGDAFWWSSNDKDGMPGWSFNRSEPTLMQDFEDKTAGFSVRCLRD